MGSRSGILSAVKANKPERVELPSLAGLEREGVEDLTAAFTAVVTSIGGRVEKVRRGDVQDAVDRLFPDAVQTGSTTKAYRGTVNLADISAPHDLEPLDVFVCKAVLGVAENGAVWVPEHKMKHRVAPFITQHLVVLLKESTLIADMHQAYEEIDIAEEGFGVFIAGPSKTADIEQSLVLGAHGPRSMTVLLQVL